MQPHCNTTDEPGALVIAERVRRNVEDLNIENINSEVKTTLTISIFYGGD